MLITRLNSNFNNLRYVSLDSKQTSRFKKWSKNNLKRNKSQARAFKYAVKERHLLESIQGSARLSFW
jgi:hypothetical protein